MLVFKTIGTSEVKLLITELLRNLDTEERDDADIVLVEHGFQPPTDKISLVFQKDN